MTKLTKLIKNPYRFFKDSVIFSQYFYRDFTLEEVCEYISDIDENKPTAILLFFAKWKHNFIRDYFEDYNIAILKRDFHVYPIIKELLEQDNTENFVWGMSGSKYMRRLIAKYNVTRVEDGFLRSKEIGLNRTSPVSLTFDSKGIHYDASKPSDLENMLNSVHLTKKELREAQHHIKLIKENGLSKYNCFSPGDFPYDKANSSKKNILIIEQVEDDKSIIYSSPEKPFGMNELIRVAIAENPDANFIFKKHPDVLSGKKKNKNILYSLQSKLHILDQNIPHNKIYEAVDVVYTISSLMGFEALLRGIKVVCLGAPFYSGWGLTDDRYPIDRRERNLSIEELFFITYCKYPKYVNPLTHCTINYSRAASFLLRSNTSYESNLWLDLKDKIESNKHLSHNEKKIAIDYLEQDKLGKDTHLIEKILKKSRINRISFDLFIAQTWIKQKETNKLATLFLKLLEKEALLNSALQLLKRIFSHYSAKERKDLVNLLLKKVSSNKGVSSRIVYCLSQEGLFKEAIHFCKTTLEDSSLSKQAEYNTIYKISSLYFHHREISLAYQYASNLEKLPFNKDKTHYLIAEIHLAKMQFKQALIHYKKVPTISNLYFNSLFKRAFCYKCLGDFTNAERNIKKLLRLRPENFDAFEMLLNLRRRKNSSKFNMERMISPYLRESHFIQLPSYNITKARLLLKLGKCEEALQYIRDHKPLANKNNYRLFIQWEANILIMSGRYDEALDLFLTIINDKDYEFTKISDLVIFYIQMRGYDTFIRNFLENEKQSVPSYSFQQKMANINVFIHESKCDLKNIFISFRKRVRAGKIYTLLKKYLNYVQSVKSIKTSDRCLVVNTNGPGDELHYASLFNELSSLIPDLTVTCDRRIQPLFEQSFDKIKFLGIDKKGLRVSIMRSNDIHNKEIDSLPDNLLISMFDNDAWERARKSDKVILATDLFADFRQSYSKYPNKNIYLKAKKKQINYWKRRIDSVKKKEKIRIGIAWRSGVSNVHRERHYTNLLDWGKIFQHQDKFEFFNVQYDDPLQEIMEAEQKFNVKIHVWDDDELDLMDDFANTAAFLNNLDYVICPSTYIAELAGGLGVKGILLDPCNSVKWKQLPKTNIHACYTNFRVFSGGNSRDNQKMFERVVEYLIEAY